MTITLLSSHGEATFDDQGNLIEDNLATEEWPADSHPVKLDMDDWRDAHPGEDPAGSHDILDWSYWCANGYWEMHMRDRHIPGDNDAQG